MKPFAKRIDNISESKSIAFARTVFELRQKGVDVVPFYIGEPDTDTPTPIIDATKDALDQRKTRYSLVPGEPELREALAKKLRTEGFPATAENILCSHGSKQILYSVFQTLFEPGDEVLIPKPYWVTIPESIKLSGATPIFVGPTTELGLNIDEVKKALTGKTKGIILNFPNNPSGMVYTQESVNELVELAQQHDLWIISDEAYEALVYDQELATPGTMGEDAFKRTITCRTFSKDYCMTGFRLGYVLADTPVIQALNKLQSHLSGNVASFIQHGAIAALSMDPKYLEEYQARFLARRDLSHGLLNEFLPCAKPQGAFYLFPNVETILKAWNLSDSELAQKILEEAHVALLPGSAFGMPGYLRISFATSEDRIKEGMARLKEFFSRGPA